jgi:hypothetical protein
VTKVRLNIAFFVVIALSAIVFLTGGFATQKAYAVGGTLDQTLCESFPTPGDWNVDTCTITSAITINSGETLIIPSGITLEVLSAISGRGIFNHGTIDNSGTFILSSGSPGNRRIENSGTIDNSGTLNVESIGTITNDGTINNPGTINNFCGTIINNGIFTGNPVNNLCDSDSDGI